MYTSGFNHNHVDKKFGFGFEDLEKMSVRKQRDVII